MQPEWKIGPEQHCLWLAIHSRWTHTDRSGYLFWNTSAEMGGKNTREAAGRRRKIAQSIIVAVGALLLLVLGSSAKLDCLLLPPPLCTLHPVPDL